MQEKKNTCGKKVELKIFIWGLIFGKCCNCTEINERQKERSEKKEKKRKKNVYDALFMVFYLYASTCNI